MIRSGDDNETAGAGNIIGESGRAINGESGGGGFDCNVLIGNLSSTSAGLHVGQLCFGGGGLIVWSVVSHASVLTVPVLIGTVGTVRIADWSFTGIMIGTALIGT